MPSRATTLDRNQGIIDSAEARAAREIAQVYNQVRKDLQSALIDGWTGTGTMTPGAATRLLQQLSLLEQVNQSLTRLEQETGQILRGVVVSADELAFEAIARELSLLPADLRPPSAFTRYDTVLVEQMVPVALEDVTAITVSMRATIRREIQAGLTQGESFPSLVRRLLSTTEPSAWRNGAVSAERLTRRLVIQANNASKQDYLRQVKARVPTIQKQAIATVGSRTTRCCLRAHGQIVDTDEPFELTAEPRFARRMMHPPFHWNCRTSIAMYHPRFESEGLNTANMKKSAQAELKRRDK